MRAGMPCTRLLKIVPPATLSSVVVREGPQPAANVDEGGHREPVRRDVVPNAAGVAVCTVGNLGEGRLRAPSRNPRLPHNSSCKTPRLVC